MADRSRRSVPHSPESTTIPAESRPGAPSSVHSEPPASAPLTGCVLRLFWMGLGNFALVICAVLAARRPAPSLLDGIYALIVVSLIIARYVDISRYRGETVDGDPASMSHWRRYVLALVPTAAAIWLFARFLHARGWL